MDIQWSLVFFTLLTGMGGCMFLFVCINEFKRISKKDPFIPGLVAAIITVVGGCASVTHLQHVERIMNALNRPSSGIFVEAVLIGIMFVFVAVWLIMLKRGMRDTTVAKVMAVLGAVFGVALSFMAGHSYMMIAYDTWNTYLLPIGYLGTALSMGAPMFWLMCAPDEDNGSATAAFITGICGIISTVTILLYAIASGAFTYSATLYAAAIICAVISAAMGFVGKKNPNKTYAIITLVAAVAAGFIYRLAMWTVGVGVYMFFD